MDFKIVCPNCAQHLEVDTSASGMVIQCPTCGGGLTVPHAPVAAVVGPTVSAAPPVLSTPGAPGLPPAIQGVARKLDSELSRKSTARNIKQLGGLAMVFGIVVGVYASTVEAGMTVGLVGTLLLIGGFFFFVLGRFME